MGACCSRPSSERRRGEADEVLSAREAQQAEALAMRCPAAALLGREEVAGCPAQAFFHGAMPLRIRADWGQAACEAGRSSYPVRRFDFRDQPQVTLAVSDAAAARQLLARHDGKSSGVYKDRPTEGALNRLLAHSLTSASPEDWPRQRQAVKMAVGSTVATAKSFQDYTAHCSAELGDRLQSIAASADDSEKMAIVDLREPIYRAACRLLCGITLGPGSTATKAADALYTLKRSHGDSKVQTGTDAKQKKNETEMWAKELNTIVRSVAAKHCSSSQATATETEELQAQHAPTAMPLIQRLASAAALKPRSVPGPTTSADNLEVQQSSRQSPPLLNFDEVVSNVHSFLLAGFETTAILVLFTLLHLAHNQTAQRDCAMEAVEAVAALQHSVVELHNAESGVKCTPSGSGRSGGLIEAALKETLRLYPPVLSLPRLVSAAGDGVVVPAPKSSAADGDAASIPVRLRAGQRITVCTAAAARVGWARPDCWELRRFYKPPLDDSDESEDSDEDTDGGEQQGEMIAFGVGPRACPAGSLSLLLARELTIAALNSVELHSPPGRPVDGLLPCAEPLSGDLGSASSRTATTQQLDTAVAMAPGEEASDGQVVAPVEARRRVEYYWEADTRALPVLALTTPADVSVKLRQAPG